MTPAEKRKLALEYAKSALYRSPFLRDEDKENALILIADYYLDGIRKGIELSQSERK